MHKLKPTEAQLKEYKAIAEKESVNMKACIRKHLEENCPKFKEHEDRFDDCIDFVTECARIILDNKSGDVADDACYKMARDYFNDDLWKVDDELKAAAKKEDEEHKKNMELKVPPVKPSVKKYAEQLSLF